MNGYMHINGVTYDLGSQKDESAVIQLSTRLRATQGTKHQKVYIEGRPVELTIELASVWSSATWVTG